MGQLQSINPEPSREESKATSKDQAQPRLKKFFDQQVDKVADRIWTLVFSGLVLVATWAAHHVPIFTSVLLNPRVALWLFPALLIPAAFGSFVFVRWLIHRHTPDLFVTVDPERCFCQETTYGDVAALHVFFEATFTNKAAMTNW
jgi:hypothetical protein